MANGRNNEVVVQSSGNVFADLGLHDAGEKQTRVRLAVAINLIIEARHLSQAAAARLLDMNQDSQRKIRHQRHKNQQNVRGKVRDNHGVDEAEARSKARRQ